MHALGRLRQENQEFKVSLGYSVRSCLKTKTDKKINCPGVSALVGEVI
jgi:hypothetical protein